MEKIKFKIKIIIGRELSFSDELFLDKRTIKMFCKSLI